uniref:Uncharacterized protein n=1 Tax=Leersia perrieri TaxID=77586 RepID=A0A0D9WXH5_9ORYZ
MDTSSSSGGGSDPPPSPPLRRLVFDRRYGWMLPQLAELLNKLKIHPPCRIFLPYRCRGSNKHGFANLSMLES